jgi:chromate reductase, NAD(P)H dehydrogenase (quinone)
MKILAFAGSGSSKSINHQLVMWTAEQIQNHQVMAVKLADFDIPIYCIDSEQEDGFPEGVELLMEIIKDSDGIIISVAEHNGNVTAFFKSIMDWLSRLDRSFLKEKQIFLLSTSPGKGAGANALELTQKSFARYKGNIAATYSLPTFSAHFSMDEITDEEIKQELTAELQKFVAALEKK